MSGSAFPESTVRDLESIGPAAFANWRAQKRGEKVNFAYEVLLYSDQPVVGEARGLGPYEIINTLRPDDSPEFPAATLALRVQVHDGVWRRLYEVQEKQDVSSFHGGSLDEEVSSLLSLALGMRLKAGHPTRLFIGGDPLGRPQTERRFPVGNFSNKSGQPIVPLASRDVRLGGSSIARLEGYSRLSASNAVSLARAARDYQEALWVSEAEPQRAWLLLVSAVETAAVRHAHKDLTPSELLRELEPALAKLLERHGQAHLDEVAERLAHLFKATKKFLMFLSDHRPDPPPKRPPVSSQLEWSPSNLKAKLNALYALRSSALHAGIPMPSPMALPPLRLKGWEAPEEVMTASASSAFGGTWEAKDVPMHLHVFEHIVREVLLKWWDELLRGVPEEVTVLGPENGNVVPGTV